MVDYAISASYSIYEYQILFSLSLAVQKECQKRSLTSIKQHKTVNYIFLIHFAMCECVYAYVEICRLTHIFIFFPGFQGVF